MIPSSSVPLPPQVLQARRNADARVKLLEEFGALKSTDIGTAAGSKASNRAALAHRWKSVSSELRQPPPDLAAANTILWPAGKSIHRVHHSEYGLRKIGVTRSELIDTDADQYNATRRWAEVLFAREAGADGLIWISRQH